MKNADEPRSLVKKSSVKIPPELAFLFNDPPLVGDEKREDYDNLFSAIVTDVKPRVTALWLLARDFADLSWEIQRERKLKKQIIKLAELDMVCKFLSPARPSLLEMPHLPPTTENLAKIWTADAETRQNIDDQLAKKGFDASFIMTLASKRVAPEIEAIDRRIANYELRRMTVWKAIEQCSEASARRLAVSTDVIEGEFAEAAE